MISERWKDSLGPNEGAPHRKQNTDLMFYSANGFESVLGERRLGFSVVRAFSPKPAVTADSSCHIALCWPTSFGLLGCRTNRQLA